MSSVQHVDQSERAYQKQETVFQNKNVNVKGAKKSHKIPRYFKNIGLGFATPKEAITGVYIDRKCPFTSSVTIRGRVLKGVVRSTKMKRTVVLRRDYLHFVPKYQRYEKRHKNLPAHVSPAFRVKEGDEVTVGECRPLSKTVKFNVIRIDRAQRSTGLKGFSA